MFKKLNFKVLIVITVLIAAVVSFGFYIKKVQADTLTSGPLTISYPGAGSIFSEMNIAPGDSFQKTLTITNNGTVNHSFSIATKNVSGNLADKLDIQPYVSGSQVWSASVADLGALPTHSKMIMSNIVPGNTTSVDLRAVLDSSIDNSYQGGSVKFDLIFGSEEAEPAATQTSTLTSTSSATQTSTTTVFQGGVIDGENGDLTTTLRTFILNVTPTQLSSTTVSPSPSVTPTPSSTPTAVTGEVKGEQTGGNPVGEDWRLLLIVPTLGILSTLLIRSMLWRALIIPIGSGIGTVVLAYFFKGSLATWIFYLILIVEVIIFLIAEYFIRRKREEKNSLTES